MKILWHSNGPWTGSGYGQQTALFAPRIAALGHDVALSVMTGLSGQPTVWNGLTCLPVGYAAHGNDVVGPHARHWFDGQPGLVVALYDGWVFQPGALSGLAVAAWTPVHSTPMSMGDKLFYASTGAQPLSMSQHGMREMTKAGLQPVYIPHGVDTQTFRPLDDDERADARAKLGIPADAFVIAVVAANKGTNPPRKAWGEQLQAFAQFRARHPEAVLFLHTLLDGGGFGINLAPLIDDLGIGDSVRVSGQYGQMTGLYTPTYVARLMGCADILSNPSMGEGFGLAALEAQAAGTPVVLADNSAQTELMGAGWLADCQPYWVCEDMAWWAMPSVSSIEGSWEKAHRLHRNSPASWARLRAKARDFAMGFDVDQVVTRYWKPALEMLEQYAGAAPVSYHHETTAVPLPTRESDGLRWFQRGAHTDDWIATGHEESMAPVFDALLPDGGVFLDVGAHVGRWGLRLAGKASRVIEVEANPDTAAVLRAHIALNGITNAVVHQVAAWDTETTLNLHDPNGKVSGGSTRVMPHELGDLDAADTFARPLDALLGGEDRIDLVKLDVEGADLHALRGMARTLARTGPRLVIERHDIYGYYELADLKDLLGELGYEHREHTAVLHDGALAPYLIAWPAGSEPA